MTRLLFVHGAGGFDEDRRLADDLGRALGADVTMPQLPDDDMSVAAWSAPVRDVLSTLEQDDLIIGHSFGATILLHVLGESDWAPRSAALLAMPDWGPDGWGVEEYVVDRPEPDQAIQLHHCRDDEVVPFAHLGLTAAWLPSAATYSYPTGGHQFDGLSGQVAAGAFPRERRHK